MAELRFPIVGSQHHPGAVEVMSRLAEGDAIQLKREPKNPYDANAICCYAAGVKLGFIPKAINAGLAGIMDSGVEVIAAVTDVALINGTGRSAALREAIRIAVTWSEA